VDNRTIAGVFGLFFAAVVAVWYFQEHPPVASEHESSQYREWQQKIAQRQEEEDKNEARGDLQNRYDESRSAPSVVWDKQLQKCFAVVVGPVTYRSGKFSNRYLMLIPFHEVDCCKVVNELASGVRAAACPSQPSPGSSAP
jgi:predicted metal-dependent peptidase